MNKDEIEEKNIQLIDDDLINFAVIGISHKYAPIEIREKVSFSYSKKIRFYEENLKNRKSEYLILSTCNRTEIYIASKNIKSEIEHVFKKLKEYSGIKEINKYIYIKNTLDTIKHLYRVSCGLDSLVLGEDQILGQIKNAYEQAIESKMCSKYLSKIFREAITFSKKVRTIYKISENPTSISSIGIKFLKSKLGTLKNKKVLIIGIGKMGKLALTYLLNEDVEITITNRTHKTATQVVENYSNIKNYSNINCIEYKDRYKYIEKFDVIITVTSSPHIVIKEQYLPALKNELIILDLAVPRDVDPNINKKSNVELYTVDDIKSIAIENLENRKFIANKINKEIDKEVDNIIKWVKNSQLDVIIKNLNILQEKAIEDGLKAIDKKFELNEKQRNYINIILRSSIKKIIREPIINLKKLEDEKQIKECKNILNFLFNWEEEIG